MSLDKETVVRRSERSVKSKRAYSPELVKNGIRNLWKKAKGGRAVVENISRVSGSALSATCIQCGGTIGNPSKCRKTCKRARTFVDQIQASDKKAISQMETLCNNCWNSQVSRKQKIQPSEAERAKYFQEARSFALSLVEILQDPLAERLFCPEYKSQPCACLQKFVLAKGMEESKSRANLLLSLLTEAKRLSRLKCYNLELNAGNTKGSNQQKLLHTIGLGNGQKRSQEFEAYVLQKRGYLRGQEVQLCERATQRVLMYSNNFLHKKLKTEPQKGSRVKRKKGKSAMGQLCDVASLSSLTCCLESCVLMALSHPTLLHQWRERAAMGQAEARRVLAEMLTPSAGGSFNCFKFIAMVTGVSHSTISKVSEQMKRTGGEREPPEHGLKKWWQDQLKRPRQEEQISTREQNRLCEDLGENSAEIEESEEALSNIISIPQHNSTPGQSLSLSPNFTFRTSNAPTLFSQIGSSFLFPSQILLNESQISPNICLSKSATMGTVEFPLVTHHPLQGTSVMVKASNSLVGSLQNSQVPVFSRLVLDEENVNTQHLSSDLENVIIFHQPTSGAPLEESKTCGSK